jgi:mRNA interferase RelE/StbE
MKYKIVLSRQAEKAVQRLNSHDFAAISAVIDTLEKEPRPLNSASLSGKYKDSLYKIRVRDFRIIYSVDGKNRIVHVKRIARRNENTYKGL